MTPPQPGSRKATSSMRGKVSGSSSSPTFLDVTGKNMTKPGNSYKAANILPKEERIDA